jgi:hypothetical protein
MLSKNNIFLQIFHYEPHNKKPKGSSRALRLQVSNEPFEIQREMIAYIFYLFTFFFYLFTFCRTQADTASISTHSRHTTCAAAWMTSCEPLNSWSP